MESKWLVHFKVSLVPSLSANSKNESFSSSFFESALFFEFAERLGMRLLQSYMVKIWGIPLQSCLRLHTKYVLVTTIIVHAERPSLICDNGPLRVKYHTYTLNQYSCFSMGFVLCLQLRYFLTSDPVPLSPATPTQSRSPPDPWYDRLIEKYVCYSTPRLLRMNIEPVVGEQDPELDIDAHLPRQHVRSQTAIIKRRRKLQCVSGWLWCKLG